MQKQNKIGVFIGRFQPLHRGHRQVIRQALSKVKHLLILVGSANSAPTIKNPWSFDKRKQELVSFLGQELISPNRYTIVPLNDYKYSDTQWVRDVNTVVAHYMQQYKINQTVLFGYEKEGNDYLKWFPNFEFCAVQSDCEDVNATKIRAVLFEQKHSSVPDTVLEDYEFFKREKQLFSSYPFPETLNFNCSDALVECSGHVLLIRRKIAPGRDTWALSGGFKQANETFQECAIRELYEETNLRVPEKVLIGSLKQFKMFDNPQRGFGIPRNSMVYHFSIKPDADGKLPRANAQDDAVETKWVLISNAVDNIPMFDDHRDIIMSMTGVPALLRFQ